MEHNASGRGVGRPMSVQWPRAQRDGKHQRQPGATQQGWRQPHVQGRQGQPQTPNTGIRAPHPDEKVVVAQESCGGRRRHRSLSERRSREPANKQYLCLFQTRLRSARVSWNGPGRGRQRLCAEVVEGDQRATFRAELERPQTPVVTADMSVEVHKLRVLVEQLSKEEGDVRPTDPAITAQHVPGQGLWGGEGFHWRVRSLGSAGKQEAELSPTCW